MSTDHILVTYTCLHFALLPSTSISNFDDTFERLSEPSQAYTDLKRKTISCHLSLPTPCDSFDCYDLTAPEWESRIESALSSMHRSLKSFHDIFIRLGKVYHGIPVATRVALSNEKICGLSHQKFGIETRTWKKDPFFKPYLEARKSIKEIERVLQWSSWSDELLIEVAKKINHCRALVSKVSGYENEIVAGIKKLHQNYTDKVNAEMESINAMNEKISEEKQKKRKQEEEDSTAAAELLRRESEATAAIKRAEEVERMAIQEAAAKQASKRGGFSGLLAKIKGKDNKPELRLTESPRPKEQQYLRPTPQGQEAEVLHEGIDESKVALDLKVIAKPSSQEQITYKAVKVCETSEGTKRKTLLKNANLTDFVSRMNGF